jgi:bifunctional DNase/RNase
MIEVRVQSLGLDQSSKTPVVILQEMNGERVLPIWIGHAEAAAIAMQLAGIDSGRPLTHDLAASLIRGLGGALNRVLISRVQENTYYAEMVVRRGDELFSIDARPSDSIAIALRCSARLFAAEDLLGATTYEMAEAVEEAGDAASAINPEMTAEELQEYLRKMNPEDFGRFNP